MTVEYTRYPVEEDPVVKAPESDLGDDRISLTFDRDEWEFIASAVSVSARWEDNDAHSSVWLRIHEALRIS
jgi:hypothetical protein